MKKNKKIDYHIHSGFLEHTNGPVFKVIEEAIRFNYDEIAIVEHFSYPFASKICKKWSLDYDTLVLDNKFSNNIRRSIDLEEYFLKINFFKKKYEQIKILIGLEVDYFSDYEKEIKRVLDNYDFDIILGSCHYIKDSQNNLIHLSSPLFQDFLSNNDYDLIYNNYFLELKKSIKSNMFDYIAHLDFIKKEDTFYMESKFRKSIEDILITLVKSGTGLEINLKGLKNTGETFPSKKIIEKYISLGGRKLSIGSDSHSLKDFKEASLFLSNFNNISK